LVVCVQHHSSEHPLTLRKKRGFASDCLSYALDCWTERFELFHDLRVVMSSTEVALDHAVSRSVEVERTPSPGTAHLIALCEQRYVTSYPEPRGMTRISTDGGAQAEWRRDGQELFYRSPDRKLMVVPIKGGATFDAGTPHALFELPPEPPAWIQSGVDQRVYAPSADGQRFLIGVPVGEKSSAPITVVLNWTAGLKRN